MYNAGQEYSWSNLIFEAHNIFFWNALLPHGNPTFGGECSSLTGSLCFFFRQYSLERELTSKLWQIDLEHLFFFNGFNRYGSVQSLGGSVDSLVSLVSFSL